MENKKIGQLSKIITLSLAVVSILIVYLVWSFSMASGGFQFEHKTPESARVEIDEMLLEHIQAPPTYGIPVSPDEPGFGRSNPFAKIQ